MHDDTRRTPCSIGTIALSHPGASFHVTITRTANGSPADPCNRSPGGNSPDPGPLLAYFAMYSTGRCAHLQFVMPLTHQPCLSGLGGVRPRGTHSIRW